MTQPSKPQPLSEDRLADATGGSGRFITGTDRGEALFGGTGDDYIDAGGGNDTINAGRGDDLVMAGGGDDTVQWSPSSGFDTIDGGDGRDTLLIQGSGLSAQDILAAITLAPDSPAPSIANGVISLAGVTGVINLNGVSLSFSNMERAVVT